MGQWFDLLGGLGVFLLGVVIMTDGLRGLAGDALRDALTRFTRSPYSGAATGAVSTAILQSSSATTVAAVGFVGAGLLTFPQALGVIFGANIGTTVTGWLVALLGFKLELKTAVMPLILIGILLKLFGRGRMEPGGFALAGFGLIFVGIAAMQSGMAGLEGQITPETFPANTWLGRFQLLLLGVVITLVTQSSSAGVAAALTAVHGGVISFEQAAALVIGMDVGTSATALFATLGGSAETRRTGYSHVVYNLFTGLFAFFFLLPYVALWQWLSPGAIYLQAEIALVGFHTLFNVFGTLSVLPLTPHFARLMEWLVPDRPSHLVGLLDRQLLKDSPVALEAVRVTLVDLFVAQVQYSLALMRKQEGANPERLVELNESVEACQAYLDQIHSHPERAREWHFLKACLHTVDHLQRLQVRLGASREAQCWQSARQLIDAGTTLDGGLRELRNLLHKKDWAGAAQLSSAMAERLNAEEIKQREAIIADIAAGREDTEAGDLLLAALVWMQRVGRHCWRVSHHLNDAATYSYIPTPMPRAPR